MNGKVKCYSVPIVISPKNFARYLVPSYLFYAFCFCLFFINYFEELNRKIQLKMFKKQIYAIYGLFAVVGISIGGWSFGRVVKKNQVAYFSSFEKQSFPPDMKTVYTYPQDRINRDLEFKINFLRDFPKITVRYGNANELSQFRLYSFPFAGIIPEYCTSIHKNKNSKYQIFECHVNENIVKYKLRMTSGKHTLWQKQNPIKN